MFGYTGKAGSKVALLTMGWAVACLRYEGTCPVDSEELTIAMPRH